VGCKLGCSNDRAGCSVGSKVGCELDSTLGGSVGRLIGCKRASTLGCSVGNKLGRIEPRSGSSVGLTVDPTLACSVGCNVSTVLVAPSAERWGAPLS
jgi:hypothetical protein